MCGVSFQFHSFPVWHDFDGGRVLVFAKVTRQPHLDCSRYSKCTKYLPVMRNVAFLAVWTLLIGQRLPPPKKRLTTSSQQKESQREKWVILCSSIIFARPLLLYAVLSMIALQVNCHCQMIRPALVPVLAKLSQKAKASTALWTKSTILLRNWMLWNMLADTLHESLAYPGQLYGDEKQPRNKKISQARKGKKKAGAGCPLSYNEYSDKQLCQWVLEMLDLYLPIQGRHMQRNAITPIRPTLPTFKAFVGWLAKFLTRYSLTLHRQTSTQ